MKADGERWRERGEPHDGVLWLRRQVPDAAAGFYCLSPICLNFRRDVGPHQIQQQTVFRRPRRPRRPRREEKACRFNRDSLGPGSHRTLEGEHFQFRRHAGPDVSGQESWRGDTCAVRSGPLLHNRSFLHLCRNK